MPIISSLGAMSSRGFGQFSQQTQGKYIEDYFSTWLYTGTGANQFISNNIALNNKISNTQYTPADFGAGLSVDSSGSIQFVGRNNSTTINGYRNGSFNSAITIPAGETNLGTYLNSCSDSSGNNYYLFITSDGTNSHTNVVKTDSTGSSILWVRRVSSGANFNGITTDGTSVYIAGYTGAPNYYGVVQKISCSTGSITWTVGRTQAAGVYLYSTCLDSSGNIYACGYTGSGGYAYLVKISSAGSVLTQNNFQGNGANTSANSVFVDSSGNIFTAGKLGGTQYFVRKQNSSFVEQWARTFTVTVNGQIYVSADSTTCAVSFADATTSLQYYAIINSSTGALISCNSVSGYIANYYNKPPIYLNDNLYLPNSTSIYVVSASSAATGTPIFSGLPLSYTSTSVTWTTTTQPTAATWSYSTSTPSMSISKTSYSLSGTANAEVLSSGGLVWIKDRTTASNHILADTASGVGKYLATNSSNGYFINADSVTGFGANGFSVGSTLDANKSTDLFASWTFRKTRKFFDIVTYTGTGVARTIPHSLGSTPGMIIVKQTTANATVGDWIVYHRVMGAGSYITINGGSAAAGSTTVWNNTSPTDSVFSVGTSTQTNSASESYIAYVFAHDAGGFGLDGLQNVISCGSFTTNASGVATVSLGYEPQYILIRDYGSAGNWYVYDTTRGMQLSGNQPIFLLGNTGVENSPGYNVYPTATGFTTSVLTSRPYIYIAIRRGPMKVPTDATTVFSPIVANATAGTQQTTNFLIDSQWKANRATDSLNTSVDDRLRGVGTTTSAAGNYLITSATSAESGANATTRYWSNTGFQIPTYYASKNTIFYNFVRAPGFMDVVCYTGVGAALSVNHNLGVVPELIITRSRSGNVWVVGNISLGTNQYLTLNLNSSATTLSGYWGASWPTSTAINYSNAYGGNNSSSVPYVTYLFATCPGVSKVGSYTGTGATQTISCGFTGGARYVMIKRTDSTGDWWVWDTTRGMVAGTDPRLGYNLTTAETNANWVYTTTGGFQIVTSDATVNASGGTYIYLAIA